MSPAPTKPWQTRLAEMDHSRGTSNKMIQDAMQSEISDLRKMLKPELVEWRRAKLAQAKSTKVEERLRGEVGKLKVGTLNLRRSLAQTAKSNRTTSIKLNNLKSESQTENRSMKREIATLRRSLTLTRNSRQEWKAAATRYQKQLIEKSLRP